MSRNLDILKKEIGGYIKDPYKELWSHLANEHNLILLESEMDEIIQLCKKILTQ